MNFRGAQIILSTSVAQRQKYCEYNNNILTIQLTPKDKSYDLTHDYYGQTPHNVALFLFRNQKQAILSLDVFTSHAVLFVAAVNMGYTVRSLAVLAGLNA